MKTAKTVMAVAMVLLLAACPRDREPQVASDTLAVTPPHDPAAMPEAAQTVELAPLAGETISAQAVVLPIGVQSQVTVHVRQAPPSTSLTAHIVTGSCGQPGPTAADLQPLVTDADGLGTSQIVVDVGPEVLFNGNHAVQLRRANGRDGVPGACGEIPAQSMVPRGS